MHPKPFAWLEKNEPEMPDWMEFVSCGPEALSQDVAAWGFTNSQVVVNKQLCTEQSPE